MTENEKLFSFFTEISKKNPQIQQVLLFGSRARGDFQEKSDFDVAIFGQIDFSTEMKILNEVEEWNFVYKVDLVFFDKLSNQTFKENILKDGKIIVNKFYQKLENYKKALARLGEVLKKDLADDIVIDATIQRFEFTMELAWKTLRAFLLEEGIAREEISSPKAVVRAAFAANVIENGDVWFAMLEARNITSHVYEMQEAEKIVTDIKEKYFAELERLLRILEENK